MKYILHSSAKYFKYAVGFANRRSFSYQPALHQMVTTSGSGHSSSSGSKSKESDSGSSDDEMKIDNDSSRSSYAVLGRFRVTNSFSNVYML